jgi:hypothetical protein
MVSDWHVADCSGNGCAWFLPAEPLSPEVMDPFGGQISSDSAASFLPETDAQYSYIRH